MDYYIFVTKACNLRCSYCCFCDQLIESAADDLSPDVEQTARFVLSDIAEKGYDDSKVFFYGGEPFMRPEWLERFVEVAGSRVTYVAQTNGTLLSSLSEKLLRAFGYLEISMDGVPEVHDAYRGEGTFDRVVENLRAIEGIATDKRTARMTYTPENPLAESVLLLLDELRFHDVYWMHEDTTLPVSAWKRNLPRYDRDLDRLIAYWMEHLRRGVVKGIVPFQSILHSMLEPPKMSYVRCGVGTCLTVIDSDGTCYPCDLMITQDKRHAVGHIDRGLPELRLPPNPLRDDRCRPCKYFYACGGRCYHLSLVADMERFSHFCHRTKLLIRKLEAVRPEVEELIDAGVIALSDLALETPMTEQIP